MKRKWFVGLLAVIVITSLVLVGCGGAKTTDKKADEKIIIKIAYGNNVGEPNDKAVREWGRLMKERSNGRVEFQYYPSSQLGSQKDVTEQLTIGSNVITISDGGFLMDYVPEFGVTYLPYIFDNKEQLYKLVDSDLFKELSKKLEAKGLYVVHSKWIYGDRHLIATKPVTKPEDLQGLKIRVPNIRLSTEMMNAMGAVATPMPLAEAYPALMQGVINGAENPLPVLYGGKMHEGAKYLMLTRHQVNLSTWIAGKKFIDTLPPDIVKMLKETGEEAGRFLEKENEKADKEALEKMKAAGVQVVEVDRAAFKERMKDFPKRFSKEFPPEVMDKVMAIINSK
ncbi:C4-dicarboxylate TRAP transporter substrate-binding protein [Sporolituus thermophilus]|uniref:Tripartite ATP-independent transporter solute receptor, DctP family n=1 Tax=Sporolituus thermophilus DSM 23256 TaxID=1123285 RepID=A0A1G7K8W9_9FIRM|nr:C4-dicarboxylate TRAP transporter substrate-binding protein [Sporolituus thermophilus]SDF33500.1 tripartite ATP-independent transporter solute receptor, DctP family [Sporolituus thermophilus DSM 23256]